MLLKDKKVLITGAGRGIGRQIAITMAEEGAVVLAAAHSEKNLRETASKIEAAGGSVYYKAFDIADYDASKAAVEELAAKAGGLDVVVNCAGIFKEAFFVDMTPEQWKETITTDLTSLYNVTHPAISYIIEAKGSVINIGSQDAFYGCPGYSHYSAAKAGLVGLTRTLARELGPNGVRVNCVAPGITETEMTKERIETGRQGYLEKLPVGRIGLPEDIANAVVFLASEKAGYITGQVIHCNGCMYLG